jgi:hypothetical protein
MAVPVPSISCCVSQQLKFFCKEKNALAFNWNRCCHLVLCLQLILLFAFLKACCSIVKEFIGYFSRMRLCDPPVGSTSPKYKLLCFTTTKYFLQREECTSFYLGYVLPSSVAFTADPFVYIFKACCSIVKEFIGYFCRIAADDENGKKEDLLLRQN